MSVENIYGIDASIVMHPSVWKASGHLQNFSDPLIDCLNCGKRFRTDKAPKHEVGSTVDFKKVLASGKKVKESGVVGTKGVVCPHCSSPHLSEERQFRGMFQTVLGPIDPLKDFVEKYYQSGLTQEEFTLKLSQAMEEKSVFLRPETAQAMFVQFSNIVQTMSAKVPFWYSSDW